ncbi:MAG: hypothetical protein PF569_05815 [Candidatus Woesearchaeota archaeon]|jgi:tRNA G37 N-methylase Trm5|nr:hypothetical protein [Candidatus Woesearchaeota archaeon]
MKKTSLKDYLKEILPEDKQNVAFRSFEVVGDIAIIEVPEEIEAYGKQIGEAIFKVNSSIKTVLKKSGVHHGEFRTQDLIYVTGENKKETLYLENGIRLNVNPEVVYFSAKLSTEREQLMENLKENEKILVMFSGAGPYSFVAYKKQPNLQRVTSIEINPMGHDLAVSNIDLNKNLVKKSKLYKSVLEFVKNNNFPIYEKVLTEIISKLKFNFINGDVEKVTQNLHLKEYLEPTDSYDNYIINQTIEKIYDSLKNSTKDVLVLDLDKFIVKSDIINYIVLFSQKFNFICKIEGTKYLFDNSLTKTYLINYLENSKDGLLNINLFDEIFMPLPKDASHFLESAFRVASKGAIIHMYDFVHENDFPHFTENTVKENAKEFGREVEIIETRKVGQYSPRKYRVCCDFKILD